MKWIKRIFAGLVILVLLFVIAAVVFIATFDPNDYKQRIEAAVEQSTGRELTLKGDINLSFFPWLGVELGAATLGNAPGFGPEPFAGVDNVDVRVALLPLFRGEVQADTVRLQGAKANLRRNAQGETNWDDLIKETGKQRLPQDQPPQPTPDVALEIGGIEVEDAAVHWEDAQAGTDIRFAPIDLTTGALAFRKPFDIELELRLKNAKPAAQARINLTAEATINPNTQRYTLAHLRMKGNATGAQLPPDGLEAVLTTRVDVDLNAGTATVRPLMLEVADLRLAGQVAAKEINTSPQIQGELNSDFFSPRELLEALGQEPPPTRDPKVLNKAAVKLDFRATQESAKLSKLEMRLDDTRLTGEGSIQSFENPNIDFVAALDAIDLDRYVPPESDVEPVPEKQPRPPADDSLGLPTEILRDLNLDGRLTAGRVKASGLTFTDLNAVVTGRGGVIKIEPLSMNLYQGTLKGRAAMDVRGNTPKFTLNSLLDRVQAGELVAGLAGDDYLTGTTRLSLNLQTQGDATSALQKALNGSLNASFKEGSILNSDIGSRVGRVVAFFRGQPGAAAASDDQMGFTSLTGSARIANGVVNNNNLALVSPLIIAKGQGQLNIAQAAMQYTLNVALNDDGKPRENRFVPLKISGALSDLSYNLALTDAIKEQTQQAIEKEVQEQEQEVKQELQHKQQELQEKLQEELQDRFNF
jgi:AsmA protein